MPVSHAGKFIIALPLAVLAATIAYPANGRNAVVLASPGMPRGKAVEWLANHGARVAARTRTGGVVMHIPGDGLALQALAAGIVLVSAPDRGCAEGQA